MRTEVQSRPPRRRMKGGMRAKQMRDVPDQALIPLFPAKLSDGLGTAVNALGLAMGYLVNRDGIISWLPVPIPRMKADAIVACVEFAGMDHARETGFVLHWVWLDKHGRAQEQYTQPLMANGGEFFRFELPVEDMPRDRDTVFSCALKITLLEQDKPILIRGAWLEILDL